LKVLQLISTICCGEAATSKNDALLVLARMLQAIWWLLQENLHIQETTAAALSFSLGSIISSSQRGTATPSLSPLQPLSAPKISTILNQISHVQVLFLALDY
jgi:hypothetical protein